MISRAGCMLLMWLPPGLSLGGSTCGGVHCSGASVYCCTDAFGEQSCCLKSIYQESWFWALLVIGLLLIAAVLFCSCRTIYRYHNAGQYTRLRRQYSDSYGSISRTVANINMPPPPINSGNENEDCDQLPSYASVMNMPPAYSETDTGK